MPQWSLISGIRLSCVILSTSCYGGPRSPVDYDQSYGMSCLWLGDRGHQGIFFAISWIPSSGGLGSSSMRRHTGWETQGSMKRQWIIRISRGELCEWTILGVDLPAYSLQKKQSPSQQLTETSQDCEPEPASHTTPKLLTSGTVKDNKRVVLSHSVLGELVMHQEIINTFMHLENSDLIPK